jgi:hypothetical protein
MSQEFYADKVSNIYVNGTTVRIDFVSLNPALQDKDGNPMYNLSGRVVIPLTGFAEAFPLYQNILGQLVEKGIISITPPAVPANQTKETEAAAHEN